MNFEDRAIDASNAMFHIVRGFTHFMIPGWRNSRPKIEGEVKPGFEKVREAWQVYVDAGYENRGQLCVYLGEEKVVDLWVNSDEDNSYGPDCL